MISYFNFTLGNAYFTFEAYLKLEISILLYYLHLQHRTLLITFMSQRKSLNSLAASVTARNK